MINYQLSQKFRPLASCEFNYITIILTSCNLSLIAVSYRKCVKEGKERDNISLVLGMWDIVSLNVARHIIQWCILRSLFIIDTFSVLWSIFGFFDISYSVWEIDLSCLSICDRQLECVMCLKVNHIAWI